MKKLHGFTRITLASASLGVLSTLLLPLWQIQLWAPQYPEGLNMKIWHNRLSGAFDIINGLNHYIGMREIRAEMFPEFKFLGILIVVFALTGAVVAWLGRREGLAAFVGITYVLGLVALWDFYRWGYDYGHNLDPHAAIIVPGMAYQPPVIGYKNLLNFVAYSGPDTGGWIVVAVGVLATGLLVAEWYIGRRQSLAGTPQAGAAILLTGILLGGTACAPTGPEPIRYGQDACFACKMTCTDQRFGSECVTHKGKVFKFDDPGCMADALHSGLLDPQDMAYMYIVAYDQPGTLLPVQTAYLLQTEALRSPMRSDIAGFGSEPARQAVAATLGTSTNLTWEQWITNRP
jgi:copper chaperone NosL